MKHLFAIWLFSFMFFSCTKEEPTPNTENLKDTVKISVNDLKFKLNPTAADEFNLLVHSKEDLAFELLLKKGNELLGTFPLQYDSNSEVATGAVKHNFSADSYNMVIRSKRENADTVFISDFSISSYKHSFVNRFTFQKVAPITQWLNFDISPSKKYIYFIDYIDNIKVLKRLSLGTGALDVISSDFMSMLVRCKSDNELVVTTKKYNDRFLQADSCAVLLYNVETKTTTFLEWGSADYGRFSRIVNNHIMITRPAIGAEFLNMRFNLSLVNLDDGSITIYNEDFRYLRQDCFDNIYNGNKIFDFNSQAFVSPLPFLSERSSIMYYHAPTRTYFVYEVFDETPSTQYSRLLAYRNNEVIFELPYEKNRSISFPAHTNLQNDKLLIYKYYSFDSTVRIDGYYEIDLWEKEVKLVHNESSYYFAYDFHNISENNPFISIRYDGLYQQTAK